MIPLESRKLTNRLWHTPVKKNNENLENLVKPRICVKYLQPSNSFKQ